MALDLLKSRLPTLFNYEIESFSEFGDYKNYLAIPDSDPVKAIPFDCIIRVNIKNAEEAKEWKRSFENEFRCLFITARTYPNSKFCPQFAADYQCHHADRNKDVKSQDPRINVETEKKYKATGCLGTIKIRIKQSTVNTRKKDKFVRKGLLGVVRLCHRHNHYLDTDAVSKHLHSCHDVKHTLIAYFKEGMNVKQAVDRYYEETNPKSRCEIPVHRLYAWYSEFKTKFGKRKEEKHQSVVVQFINPPLHDLDNDAQLPYELPYDSDSDSDSDSDDDHVQSHAALLNDDIEDVIDAISQDIDKLKRKKPSQELLKSLTKLKETTGIMLKCGNANLPGFIDRLAGNADTKRTTRSKVPVPVTVMSPSRRQTVTKKKKRPHRFA